MVRDSGLEGRIVEAIRAAWNEKGYAPTVREIGGRVGVTGSATLQAAIGRLVHAGTVTHVPGSPRTLRLAGGV